MKKRILFLIYELTISGTGKVFININNNINRDKFDIFFINILRVLFE